MNYLNLMLLEISILLILIVVFLFMIYLKIGQESNFDKLHLKMRKDINSAVAPNFISVSPSSDDFFQFAVEIWRLEQRFSKIKSELQENQNTGIANALNKIKKYLEKNDVEITDYTGKKFNEGLNLEVLSIEKDETANETIVKETVEPTVFYKGQVVRKAKVILLSKQDQI